MKSLYQDTVRAYIEARKPSGYIFNLKDVNDYREACEWATEQNMEWKVMFHSCSLAIKDKKDAAIFKLFWYDRCDAVFNFRTEVAPVPW